MREAIEEYHLKKKREREITEAADRLLSLPPMPVPENWEEFEAELGRLHGFHNGMGEIISVDGHFDLIPKIKGIDPIKLR